MLISFLETQLLFQEVVGGQAYAAGSSQNMLETSSRHTDRVQAGAAVAVVRHAPDA